MKEGKTQLDKGEMREFTFNGCILVGSPECFPEVEGA